MPYSQSKAARRRSWRSLIPVAIALTPVAVAQADNFWQPQPDAVDEAQIQYELSMKLGDKNAIVAGRLEHDRDSFPTLDPQSRMERLRFSINRAIANYEKAFEARPDAPEPYYRAAEVINRYYLERRSNIPVIAGRYRKKARKAIAYWQQFERLSPLDPRVRETLFNRALVHTKMADEVNYRQALALYEAIIRRSDVSSELRDNVATWYGNMAETYMMVGELDRAIENYRIALENADRATTAYGMAVALDRDEQGDLARDLIRRYGDSGLYQMRTDSGVFFVPDGERNYYIALGYDALGDWDNAAKYYREFIRSGAHPRYQERAKENLAWILQKRKERRKQRIKPPRLPRRLGI